MPGRDGISATSELIEASPHSKVMILTTFEEDDYIHAALRAGASGFLLKRTSPEDLVAGVHRIAEGEALKSHVKGSIVEPQYTFALRPMARRNPGQRMR